MRSNKFFLLVIALLCSESICAQNYKPVDKASEVKFTAENLGIDYNGFVGGLNGRIVFNPTDLNGSTFIVSVDANTFHTGVDLLDNHVKKKKDFLDTDKYPTISFTSTAISRKQNVLTVIGLLTIKDVTKTVSFPFTARTQNNGVLFTANFRINRKDFHIGGGFTVRENVDISLRVLAEQL